MLQPLLSAKKEVRITTIRMVVLTLLVVLITSSPGPSTPPAEASSFEKASEFAEFLCENYLGCD